MRLTSVEKCLAVVELLSLNPHGLRLSELSAQLQSPASSVHHILDTLRYHGYVLLNPETKRYQLGFRFVEISSRILDHLDIRTVAREHLRYLNECTGQTVHLAVLQDDKVIYIDKLGAQAGLSLVTYVGFATDAYATAGGKVLLSELDESRIRRMYEGKRLRIYGKKTITSVDRLIQELETVRRQGYAIDDEEYYEGVRCVAAPIRAGSKAVAALSITGSVFALTKERIEAELKDLVMHTAAQISAKLTGCPETSMRAGQSRGER